VTDESTTSPFVGGLRRGATAASHFLILSNLAARDPRMSLRARGLFATGMSFAEGWKITEEELARHCTDGEKSIRSGLVELRELGYVYRGRRSRYPAGTRNHKGKDISGALGPYEWFWTDKPDEIAAILEQYAKDQRAAYADPEPAGEDYLPETEVVPSGAVDNPGLPPERAASADQGKGTIPPGRNNLPRSRALKGSTKEDQPRENQEDQGQGPADCVGAPDALRLSGPETSTAAGLGGPVLLDPLTGDQQNAGAENVERGLRELEELAASRKWQPPTPPAPPTRPRLTGGSRRTKRADLDPVRREVFRREHLARTAGATRNPADIRADDGLPAAPATEEPGRTAGTG
jgi:hypothetical protein